MTDNPTCDFSTPDGNRDDPEFYYCGHPHGHTGPHGAWQH